MSCQSAVIAPDLINEATEAGMDASVCVRAHCA